MAIASDTLNGLHNRQQLPLIHKSQGLTLSIDIGKTEKTAGISYVAIGRVKHFPHVLSNQ